MFVYAKSSQKLFALFFTVALVQMVLAVSPCPSGYTVVVRNSQCVCKYGSVYQPISSSCTWTRTGNDCHVTCPTGSNERRRRQLPKVLLNEDGSISNCPKGETSCPITTAHGSRHECVNIKKDLDNCGGCTASGHGAVCGREPGVRSASCDGGICYIHSCRSGYHLDMHTQRCKVKH